VLRFDQTAFRACDADTLAQARQEKHWPPMTTRLHA